MKDLKNPTVNTTLTNENAQICASMSTYSTSTGITTFTGSTSSCKNLYETSYKEPSIYASKYGCLIPIKEYQDWDYK
ncbi:MAG: hypothetical protein WCO65_03765 [bacterium]